MSGCSGYQSTGKLSVVQIYSYRIRARPLLLLYDTDELSGHRACAGRKTMKFVIFYEHQYPRPWTENGEEVLLHEALDQLELADKLGIDYAWEVEHHFLEEYSHSSAPEVFLAAASQRTSRIRLGHGITLMPPGYNACLLYTSPSPRDS